jgi:putative ABC transport system ATP-binding protein
VTPSGDPLLELDGVSKRYAQRVVLDDVDLSIGRGELLSLVGASGSGKSTLLSLIAALSVADGGSIRFDGHDVGALDDEARAKLRGGRIGIVLQSGNLLPFLTAEENVELATHFSEDAAGHDALDELGVADRRDHLPRRMSGGQAQRVAVAVALANRPDLLLADEVTGQLDSKTADSVMEAILDVRERHGLTVLYVTHDHALASRADHRLVLEAGRVREG